MPTVKIANIAIPCTHIEHNPPMNYAFSPGVYKHTCPNCGHNVTFVIPSVSLENVVLDNRTFLTESGDK